MAPRKPKSDDDGHLPDTQLKSGPAAENGPTAPPLTGEGQPLAAAMPAAPVLHSGKEERMEARVASPIDHDGVRYSDGDPIHLTEAEFERLRLTGALQERAWDECSIIF